MNSLSCSSFGKWLYAAYAFRSLLRLCLADEFAGLLRLTGASAAACRASRCLVRAAASALLKTRSSSCVSRALLPCSMSTFCSAVVLVQTDADCYPTTAASTLRLQRAIGRTFDGKGSTKAAVTTSKHPLPTDAYFERSVLRKRVTNSADGSCLISSSKVENLRNPSALLSKAVPLLKSTGQDSQRRHPD